MLGPFGASEVCRLDLQGAFLKGLCSAVNERFNKVEHPGEIILFNFSQEKFLGIIFQNTNVFKKLVAMEI